MVLLKKKKLKVVEFHQTRKLLKHFLAITTLGKDQRDGESLKASYHFLNEINDKLGSLRDDVLEDEIKAINHGEEISEEEFQEIPQYFKIVIKSFLESFTIRIE